MGICLCREAVSKRQPEVTQSQPKHAVEAVMVPSLDDMPADCSVSLVDVQHVVLQQGRSDGPPDKRQQAAAEALGKAVAGAPDEGLEQHIFSVMQTCQPVDRGVAESLVLQDMSLLAGPHGRAHDIVSHGAPRPPNDEDRGDTITAIGMEDDDSAAEFSLFCQVVTRMYGYKYSALSLFAQNRVWVAGAVGMPIGHVNWRMSACPWDLLVPSPTTMVCEDLREDARFEHQPWTKAGWRTYISAPLIASNGHRIGAICILDDIKHSVDAGQCRLLNNLAELGSREVERLAKVAHKMREDDVTRSAYTCSKQKLQRDIASAQTSCLLILDTSVPGWEILYANSAWEQWTGVPRESVLGQPLSSVLENALDGSPLRWQEHAEAVQLSQRLVFPKLQARAGGSAAVAAGRGTMFDLSCRAATIEALDNDTLPIDIPTFVDMGSSMTHIYVARLHAVNTSVPFSGLGTVGRLNSLQVSPMILGPLLIYGLRLHQVIGRGGYGSVYAATWQDNRVAAKVQDFNLQNVEEEQEAALEISIGQTLTHGNLVGTLAHASVALEHKKAAQPSLASNFFIDDFDDMFDDDGEATSRNSSVMSMLGAAESFSDANSSGAAGSRHAGDEGLEYHEDVPGVSPAGGAPVTYPHEIRAFQVLDFCDRGTLQDAIDRGWLRSAATQVAEPNVCVVLATALDIAGAVEYMHQRDIVHGDLTAYNVLLKRYRQADVLHEAGGGAPQNHFHKDGFGRDFRAKVADFGKSRHLGALDYIRTSSYGTITHMAPEVLASSTLGRPADIYAFGVLLWAMWTGARPWAGLSHTQIMSTVTSNAQRLVFPATTPVDVAQLGACCLTYNSTERPDAAEIVRHLMAMLESRGATGSREFSGQLA